MNTVSELERAADVIKDAGSLALACHVDPDGDALGSMLAMLHLARAAGKPVMASWPDVMVTFDCGSIERLRELGAPAHEARELIVVDHHATNDRYGTVNLVEP